VRELLTRRVRHSGDSGVTLVELLISMTIFSIVIALTYSVLFTIQRQTKDTTARADAVGDARIALQQIDRQVRSGNVLYSPANETGTAGCTASTVAPSVTPNAGNCMRIYTQANGEQRCVQWQVAAGVIRSRSWSPTWETDGLVSDWAVIAHNTVNTTASPPFILQGGATAYGSRLVDIELRIKNPESKGAPVNVTSSLSGRNTAYGYDPGICSPVPAV
jgi:prepilin-type N-terminal cleavage/methylation domain-containing protein